MRACDIYTHTGPLASINLPNYMRKGAISKIGTMVHEGGAVWINCPPWLFREMGSPILCFPKAQGYSSAEMAATVSCGAREESRGLLG